MSSSSSSSPSPSPSPSNNNPDSTVYCQQGFPFPPAVWIFAAATAALLAFLIYRAVSRRRQTDRQLASFRKWSRNRLAESSVDDKILYEGTCNPWGISASAPGFITLVFNGNKMADDTVSDKIDALNALLAKRWPRLRALPYSFLCFLSIIIGVLCTTVLGNFTCLDSRPLRITASGIVTVPIAWTIPFVFNCAMVFLGLCFLVVGGDLQSAMAGTVEKRVLELDLDPNGDCHWTFEMVDMGTRTTALAALCAPPDLTMLFCNPSYETCCAGTGVFWSYRKTLLMLRSTWKITVRYRLPEQKDSAYPPAPPMQAHVAIPMPGGTQNLSRAPTLDTRAGTPLADGSMTRTPATLNFPSGPTFPAGVPAVAPGTVSRKPTLTLPGLGRSGTLTKNNTLTKNGTLAKSGSVGPAANTPALMLPITQFVLGRGWNTQADTTAATGQSALLQQTNDLVANASMKNVPKGVYRPVWRIQIVLPDNLPPLAIQSIANLAFQSYSPSTPGPTSGGNRRASVFYDQINMDTLEEDQISQKKMGPDNVQQVANKGWILLKTNAMAVEGGEVRFRVLFVGLPNDLVRVTGLKVDYVGLEPVSANTLARSASQSGNGPASVGTGGGPTRKTTVAPGALGRNNTITKDDGVKKAGGSVKRTNAVDESHFRKSPEPMASMERQGSQGRPPKAQGRNGSGSGSVGPGASQRSPPPMGSPRSPPPMGGSSPKSPKSPGRNGF